jgi:drug/metabolite transporter (DMT)-like permease
MSSPTDAATPPSGVFARTRALGQRSPISAVVFGVVLFSTGPVMVAGASVSGPIFSFWRLWIGVVVLGIATLIYCRSRRTWPTLEGWKWAAICGLAFGFHQLTFMTALRLTSVVDVTLMNTIAPIVVGVLAVPMFGERPGVSFRAWSVVAIGGTAIVVLAGSSGPNGDPVGMLLAALNVVGYSFYFVWSKLARDKIETVPFLFGATLFAALSVSACVLWAGEPVGEISAHDLLLCFLVAVLPGFFGHFSVTWSLRWVPANIPPVIMLAIPVLSGVMAWVFVGQGVAPAQVLGGVITIIGVAGALRSSASLSAAESLVTAEET